MRGSVESRPPARDVRWELVGGHPALDLVNTVAWRHEPHRTIDRLTGADMLLTWSVAAGLLSGEQEEGFRAEVTADASLGSQVLEQSRSVRSMAYQLLQPVAHGQPPSNAHVQAVHSEITAALGSAQVVDVVPWRWEVELRTVRSLPTALTVVLWRLLQFEDLHRLRECLDRGCGWLFLDRSKNASRVWCSSADCGNRSRARRHYRRHVASDLRGASRSHADGTEVTG